MAMAGGLDASGNTLSIAFLVAAYLTLNSTLNLLNKVSAARCLQRALRPQPVPPRAAAAEARLQLACALHDHPAPHRRLVSSLR
jgi:hypothetical protein